MRYEFLTMLGMLGVKIKIMALWNVIPVTLVKR
jgi:hypothetical protein